MKYILCLDKLGAPADNDDISLFVETFHKRGGDEVEIECYDTKEKATIPADLFLWMVRNKILTEY